MLSNFAENSGDMTFKFICEYLHNKYIKFTTLSYRIVC